MALRREFEDKAPAWPILSACVFLTAGLVLAYQIALTRLFSALLRYHFVFLVVSIAVWGLGLGALLGRAIKAFSLPGLLFSFSVGLLHLGLVKWRLILMASKPIFLAPILAVPFAFAGWFMASSFRAEVKRAGALYFADLTGAATASVLVLFALDKFGGLGCPLVLSAVASLVPLLIGASLKRPIIMLLSALIGALALLALRFGGLSLPALGVDSPILKPLFSHLGRPGWPEKVLKTEWTTFARTDLVEDIRVRDSLYIYTDGDTPTQMFKFDGDLLQLADDFSGFIGLFPFIFVKPRSVFSIGPGGGGDILLALLAGAREVEGAEVNPSIFRMMREFSHFNGGVYDLPGVRIELGDARSILESKRRRYDLIYSALTQTATQQAAGAAYIESYVLTVEAFRLYLDRLTEKGCFVFICQERPLLYRAMLITLSALGLPEREGMRHMAMLSIPERLFPFSPYRFLLAVFKSPVERAFSERMLRACVAMRFVPVYFPGVFEPGPLRDLASGNLKAEGFVEKAREDVKINIRPPTDERPFFFDLFVKAPALPPLFWASVVVALLLIGAGTAKERSPRAALWGLYFGLLGVGFMLVEVTLAQRLTLYLGFPVLSLAVVLFGMLLGAGLGSRLSQRVEEKERIAIAVFWACLTVATLSVLLGLFGLEPLRALFSLPVRARAFFLCFGLVVFSLPMGFPFPSGLRLVGERRVPWAMAVNGIASVAGGTLALLLIRSTGQGMALCFAAVLYLLAALLMVKRP